MRSQASSQRLKVTKTLFNSVTRHELEQYVKQLPGSMLLTGDNGVGLTAAAEFLASSTVAVVSTVLPEKDEKIDIEKGTITVDSIRKLYELTKTKQPKGRVVIIDYAERMGKAAQNAFLKLLEEPGAGTHFMLLTHQPHELLPTILSRVQRIDVRPITKQQSEELLDSLKVRNDRQRAQLLYIATGLPAELTRLVNDTKYFSLRTDVIKDAREYVIGNAYARLLIAKKYKDDRQQAMLLLTDAMRLLKTTIANGGAETSIVTIDRLVTLYGRIKGNGNIRLQLASL
jgi:hypothetical protein